MNGAGILEVGERDGANRDAIRCLVVDDHPALRDGVAAALSGEDGIEVVGQATDGRSAVALRERRRPAVVVLDIQMPGMGGLECCEQLRGGDDPPAVILYTAFDDPQLLDAGLEAGAIGFVLKAAPLADMARAVRTVAAGRMFIDPELTSSLLARRDRDAAALSPREVEVLRLLADGMTTEAAGKELFLSPATIRSYAESAMRKLDSRNRVHAIATAIRQRLID